MVVTGETPDTSAVQLTMWASSGVTVAADVTDVTDVTAT